VGKLKTVYHSGDKFMELRSLISGYQDLNQEIVRTKNRYNALFRRVAITNDEGGKFYHDRELIKQLSTPTMRFVAEPLFEQIKQLEEHKKKYEQEFEKNARRYKEIRLLMTIPGIGVKHANRLVGVLVTPHRFPSKYKLRAYAKLVQHSRTSDGKPCGRKASQGQAVLKDVFKNAALAAIRSDCALRRRYESMVAAGKNERDARNDVARRIAATVLGVWKSGKEYDDKRQEVTREREPRQRK
jgi:transposase